MSLEPKYGSPEFELSFQVGTRAENGGIAQRVLFGDERP